MKTKINKVGIEGYYLTTAYWTGENSLYLCAGPQNSMTPFIFPFFLVGGHTSSTSIPAPFRDIGCCCRSSGCHRGIPSIPLRFNLLLLNQINTPIGYIKKL